LLVYKELAEDSKHNMEEKFDEKQELSSGPPQVVKKDDQNVQFS